MYRDHNTQAIEEVARDLLHRAQAQYPGLALMGQDAGIVQSDVSDLAIVILSPQGMIRLLGGGGGSPASPLLVSEPGGGQGQVEVGSFALTKDAIVPYGTSLTYSVEHLMDVRGAFLDLIIVDSSCNQALTIQAIGHTQDAPSDVNGRVNLGGGQAIAAGNTTVQRLGIAIVRRDYPYPFIGVTVASGGTPPTTGGVQVSGFYERWPRSFGGFT